MFSGDLELVEDFVTESREGLSGIEDDLLTLESGGESPDSKVINRVFRAIHSIKGASGFLGLDVIGALSHSLENILSLMRNQEMTVTPPRIEAMLQAVDKLASLIENVETSNDQDVTHFVTELDGIASGKEPESAATKPPQASEPAPENAAATSKDDDARKSFTLSFDLLTNPDIERDVIDFLTRLQDLGEISGSTLNWADVDCNASSLPESIAWNIRLTTILDRTTLCSFLQIPETHAMPCDVETPAESQVAESPLPEGNEVSREVTVPTPAASTAPEPIPKTTPEQNGNESSASGRETSIRVSVPVLNRLMNLAGELVLGRNQLLQQVSTVDSRAIETVAGRIDQVTSELQEAIMQTRLQPIGIVFNKFTRVVRELSKQLGKQCKLLIEGREVELDKTIIEAIGDPLTHLIRNAVDHGIEPADVRQRAGKPAEGTVELCAFHQEGKVHIVIRDDGAGMDSGKLRAKAVERGILTSQQADALSESDALQLIFHPGFSTAEKISSVSGRGVGMDVVKTNFERLGGTIDLATQLGKGSTITVRLPLTLAIIPSLIVKIGDTRYAVPQASIRELVRVRKAERHERIERVREDELLRLRGDLVPLVRLENIAESPERVTDTPAKDDTEETLNIIVVSTGGTNYGLVVDELHDPEEIVFKPLGHHLKATRWLSGATILGDGCVAMILDVLGIAALANLSQRSHDKALADGDQEMDSEMIPTLLLANHPDEQFGIPMDSITRIESIASSKIETLADQQIIQYRGSTLPLIRIEDHISAQPRQANNNVYIIICQVEGKEVGLIAPLLRDTCTISSELDLTSLQEQGVLGTAIINEKTTRLLDIFELARLAYPEWVGVNAKKEEQERTVLLAEDTAFFRTTISQFLADEGWNVIECEDGQQAWETLNEEAGEIDLVVTDIEMPYMNGFELCENIRRDSRFRSLPVISVTSLADEKNIMRGQEVGLTHYLVKLNRDQLKSAINECFPASNRRKRNR